jgi:NAD(P)-dependent dehydrogenase (short-subunit alcohol dehydrogenase family)
MDLGLEGKVAVVTGASRGIGRAVVAALLEENVKVVAGARHTETLAGLDDVIAVAGDLSQPEGPAKLVDAAVAAHGGIDFLVNNAAGVKIHLEGFAGATDDDWSWTFETNLMSAVRTTRAALPHLLQRRGAIVNVSSLNGRIPATEGPEYSAMKAALNNLSRSLALELAPKGVRVNVVSPGPVLTDMQTRADGIGAEVVAGGGGTIDDYVAAVENAVPLGRWAQPEEIASVVISLLSEKFGYVTGAEVAVDGATQAG